MWVYGLRLRVQQPAVLNGKTTGLGGGTEPRVKSVYP